MTGATMLGTLVVLALIDSTSFGTLLIPIWLLTTPGPVRVGRTLVYLGTVTLAYFAIGLLIMFGAGVFVDRYGDVIGSTSFLTGQLVLGIALMVVSQLMDSKKARARAAERAATGGGRLLRWRTRVMGDEHTGSGSKAALVVLALTAVAIEVASMVPYLAAIGIIAAQGPAWPASGVLLLGYCLVMVAPALRPDRRTPRRPQRPRTPSGVARRMADQARDQHHRVGHRHRRLPPDRQRHLRPRLGRQLIDRRPP